MQQQSENATENHGALIRDILQAFAGVVSAQGSSKVPVNIPTQHLPSGETHVPGNDQSVGDGILFNVCVCVCVCVCASMCKCVCVCVRACVRA